jgi:hypothetical protein
MLWITVVCAQSVAWVCSPISVMAEEEAVRWREGATLERWRKKRGAEARRYRSWQRERPCGGGEEKP